MNIVSRRKYKKGSYVIAHIVYTNSVVES